MSRLLKTTAIIFVLGYWLLPHAVSASVPVNAYFFYGETCPHCAKEGQFLTEVLKKEFPDLTIYGFEVYNNANNVALLKTIAEKLNARADGVPFLVIGDLSFIGYSEEVSPDIIRARVTECSLGNCTDVIAEMIGIEKKAVAPEAGGGANPVAPKTGDIDEPAPAPAENETQIVPGEKLIKLPFFGKIDAVHFSLPVLTIVMGLLDGFNPCAMWALIFLISLLLGMGNRKRMWLLGTVFIVASAAVYFVFMAAWLSLILFLGFIIWIRLAIGVLALFGGGYSLKEFMFAKSGCSVVGSEKKLRTFEKIKAVIQQKSLWLSLGGMVVLAFAVNLVELICSAGLPAVYTQVLALNGMPGWKYYLYILAYVFFFMLDDLLVFFIAMITLQLTGVTTKYSKISRLVGGLVMSAVGLMLILKPEWLMFG